MIVKIDTDRLAPFLKEYFDQIKIGDCCFSEVIVDDDDRTASEVMTDTVTQIMIDLHNQMELDRTLEEIEAKNHEPYQFS